VTFASNSYFLKKVVFLPPIAKSKTVDIEVTLTSTGSVSPLQIPEIVQFSIQDPNGNSTIHCEQDGIPMQTDTFIADLLGWTPPVQGIPALNVLCFGVVGSGKSSFVNGILTCLTNQVQSPAAVGGSSDHTTKKLIKFALSDVPGLESVKINLLDLWGLDKANYKAKQLLDLLQGRLVDGYEMVERKPFQTEEVELYVDDYERMVHAVLLFVPLGICDDHDLLGRVKESLRIGTVDYEINPLIIVTRASSEDVKSQEQIRSQIGKELNYPISRIYLVDNYVTQKVKTFGIDRLTLAILHDVINTGSQYMRQNRKRLVRNVGYGTPEKRRDNNNELVPEKALSSSPKQTTPEKEVLTLTEAAALLQIEDNEMQTLLDEKQVKGKKNWQKLENSKESY